MTKEQRYQIIQKIIELEGFCSINSMIDSIIMDELMYAGVRAKKYETNVEEEFYKVLETYNFEGYTPSSSILNYIKHYSLYPEVAAMQHVDLNDMVSYIGEYYDGTPTAMYRKKGRYEVEPIKL